MLRVSTLLVLVVIAATVQPAFGSSISLSPDVFDPADVLFTKTGGACTGSDVTDTVTGLVNGACNTLTFSQSLTGFDSSTDTITAAILTLAFYNAGSDPTRETVDVTLDSTLAANNILIQSSTSTSPFKYDFSVSAYIDAAGNLSTVLLSRGNQGARNDFYFADSTLTAMVNRTVTDPNVDDPSNDPPVGPTTPVPEPGSLVLFGTGAACLVRKFRPGARS